MREEWFAEWKEQLGLSGQDARRLRILSQLLPSAELREAREEEIKTYIGELDYILAEMVGEADWQEFSL